MKINELRLENFINFSSKIGERHELHKVTAINKNEVFLQKIHEEEEVKCKIEDCHSVRLTDSWLEYFGFEKHKQGRKNSLIIVKYSYRGLDIVNWGDGIFRLSNSFSRSLKIEIKTVHQLQNIFFEATGKELKTK